MSLSFAMCLERAFYSPRWGPGSGLPPEGMDESEPGFEILFQVYREDSDLSPYTGAPNIADTTSPNGWTVVDASGEGHPTETRCRWFRVTCPDEFLSRGFGLKVTLTWFYVPTVIFLLTQYVGEWKIPRWGTNDSPGGESAQHTFPYEQEVTDDQISITPSIEADQQSIPRYLRAWSETDNIIPDWDIPGELKMHVTHLAETYEVAGALDWEQAARGVLGREALPFGPVYPGDYEPSAGIGANTWGFRPAVWRSYAFGWPALFTFINTVSGEVTFQLFDKYGRYNQPFTFAIGLDGLDTYAYRKVDAGWTIFGGGHWEDNTSRRRIYASGLITEIGSLIDNATTIDPDGPDDVPGKITRLATALVIISRLCRIHVSYDEGANWNYIMQLEGYTLLAADADARRGALYAIVLDENNDPFVAVIQVGDDGTLTETVTPMMVYGGHPNPSLGTTPAAPSVGSRPKRPGSLVIMAGGMMFSCGTESPGAGVEVFSSYNEAESWYHA